MGEYFAGRSTSAREDVRVQKRSEEVQSEFASYEQETLSKVEPLALDSALGTLVALRGEQTSEDLFELLLRNAPQGISVEIYDTTGDQLGWNGNEGPAVPSTLFTNRREYAVLQGPLYTYLLISIPLQHDSDICGYLVAKRLFDVSYPISNRFIANSAFVSTFPKYLKYPSRFDFTGDALPDSDSSILSIHLRHLNGIYAGYAYCQRPTEAVFHGENNGFWYLCERIFLLLAVAWILFGGALIVSRTASGVVKGLAWTISIWLFRYSLLALGIPSGLMSSSLFSPKYYASAFGMGIAGSPGELAISSAFLLANAVILFRLFGNRITLPDETGSLRSLTKRLMQLVHIAALVFVVLLLVRGFASVIQSAVDDSTLVYNDPASMLPSLPIAAMLGSLLFIAVSLCLVVGIIILQTQKILSNALPRVPGTLMPIICSFAILAFGSVIFGYTQSNPLLNQWQRIVILAILFAAAMGSRHFLRSGRSAAGLITGLVLASVFLIVPLLNAKNHDVNHARVEMVAQEILRPESSWLTFLTSQALDDLSGESALRLLESGDSLAMDKMGFTEWASSILSREGNNCSVTYFDPRDSVVSDFHIGIPPHSRQEHVGEIQSRERWVRREQRSGTGESETWYAGYSPIRNDSGTAVGGVLVELSGKKPFTVRGEPTNILRNEVDPRSGGITRPIIYSEYYQGKLISSTDDRIAFDHPFPEMLNQDHDQVGIWIDEVINGKSYQTYYAPDTRIRDDGWIALSLESLGWMWQVYTFLRYGIFFACILLPVLALLGLRMLLRGIRLQPGVRAKLLIAFAVVSFIPVVILGYYDRRFTISQAEDAIDQSLTDKTSIIAAELQHALGMNIPVALRHLSDLECATIADDVNSDFTVYFRGDEQASSKPELFTAQVLDPRLSAEAFVNLFLRKRSYFSEREVIGSFPYVVGYRPLVAENGKVIGALAVPTLFQQSDIDQEITRRNVFLYGTYALALFVALIAGTLFANQISLPIRRLREAAERISRGEMSVQLREAGNDELGRLESSFSQMVKDLQRVQEKMKKTERELAWKEMAKQVAHEIKNPLTPMKLSVQHLRQAYRDGVGDFSSILNKVSETILDQIEVLTRIASEFSNFARMPERNLQQCSIHAILEETRQLFQHHPHVIVTSEYEAAGDIVLADHDELLRAFINLVRNSVQAMDEHGQIFLRTKGKNAGIAIQVTDSGPGMSDEARAHLFEPTFSTKTEGTGLGLAIVKKTVDDLDGNVVVESVIGRGTTVSIWLPIFREQV